MVEVLTNIYQGILTDVYVFKHKSGAAQKRKELILEEYENLSEYKLALDDSNADPLVQHWTNLEVE